MTYNELAELFKREGGDAQVCFSVISQNQILFGNNDTKKGIIGFKNEEPIKWAKETQEESVNEDLENAANSYIDNWYKLNNLDKESYPIDVEISKNDFKAGAKWQKEQMIDKACEWLENLFAPDGSIIPENIKRIEDFKNYMK